jgi:hypothetical protein
VQNLGDAVPDLVREAVGHGLKVTVEIQVGDERGLPAEVEAKVNDVLEQVKAGMRLE